jgi:hypothetical protein
LVEMPALQRLGRLPLRGTQRRAALYRIQPLVENRDRVAGRVKARRCICICRDRIAVSGMPQRSVPRRK